MPSRRRLYWACQLLGWALFNALFYVVGATSGGLPSVGAGRLALFLTSNWALNIAATHVLHTLSSRWGWAERPLAGLLARVGPIVITLAIVTSFASNLVVEASDLIFGPLAPVSPPPVRVDVVTVSGAVFGVIVFGAWAVVYYLAVYAFRARDAERDALALRASLAESRLGALRAQLDPHFLFNALNTVRALVLEDPHEARRAVTLLSGLLRETLESSREATHSLSDEVALVRPYLELESIRFGERLRVDWDIAAETEAAEVPAHLLLTLVENAVKHGIARREAGGDLRIRVSTDTRRLAVSVESPAPDASPSPNGTGTGLANARERLALLHGDSADLTLDLGPHIVTATARLPLSHA